MRLLAIKRICILLILLVNVNSLISQDIITVDSLYKFKKQINKNENFDSIQFISKKDKILALAKSTNDEKVLFYAYSVLGDIYRNEGYYSQAINSYFKALESSKSVNNSIDLALIYDALARIYLNKGEIGLMFESIGKSLTIKQDAKNEKEINKTKQILSKYYRSTGNFSEVLRLEFNSLSYYMSINDSARIALTYNRIGVTYYSINSYDKALSYYKLSEAYYKNSGDKRGLSSLLNNIGIVLLDQKKCQDALEKIQKSIEIEKELGNYNSLLIRYNNLGLAYACLGNYETAYSNINLCINRFKKKGDLINLANAYESMAHYYDLKGNSDSLEFFLLETYKLSESLSLKKVQLNAALKLSLLYKDQNDIKKSFIYLTKYKELDDSLFHSGGNQKITDEEFNFLRSKDNELQKVEKRNTIQKYIIVIGCLLILTLATWMLLLMQRHKAKINEKINKNLEEKVEFQQDELLTQGKELVSKTLQLGSNSSEVNYAIQQLKKLQTEFGVQGKQKIQHLILDLEYNQNKNIWSEFELRFSKVNKNFYEKLLAKHPSLTISERRLAALILLNFSTKEIATITKQNYRSVLVAKSRLRKKMNIPPSEDLSKFLNDLLTS